jgi:hypothetical protein
MLDDGGFQPCEKRIEGQPHFASGHGYTVARGAVVEAPVINETAMGIVEKKVRRALGVIGLCDGLAFIVEERERKCVFDRHLAKFVGSVVGVGGRVVGADGREPDTFWLVLAGYAENLLANVDNIRTVSADEHHKQRSGGRQGRERQSVSGDDIREGEIGSRGSKRDGLE